MNKVENRSFARMTDLGDGKYEFYIRCWGQNGNDPDVNSLKAVLTTDPEPTYPLIIGEGRATDESLILKALTESGKGKVIYYEAGLAPQTGIIPPLDEQEGEIVFKFALIPDVNSKIVIYSTQQGR